MPKTLLARYLHLTKRMEDYGPNLGMPHTKPMKNGLFELRLKGAEGIGRVFYCTMIRGRIVMLHNIVKKTGKTPKQTITLARKRMKEVKNNDLTR